MKRKSLKSSSKPSLDFSTQYTCKNCGHEDTGKYCSACGQSFVDYNRPLRQVFNDLVGLISLDSSIFRTIAPFLFKPGFIAREYLNGKRKKYMSPVRLYLFMSIVFFFIASKAALNNPDGLENVNLTQTNDTIMDKIPLDEQFLDALKADSTFVVSGGDTIFSESTSSDRDVRLVESVIKVLENKALFITDLFKNISLTLFVLMPIFALILKLLYIRRKRYYLEHLIFTLNIHSFTLLVLTVLVSIQFLIKGNDDFLVLIALIIPVYFLIGMKRFYQQKFWKILLKSMVLGTLYLSLLISALLGLAYLTAIRM